MEYLKKAWNCIATFDGTNQPIIHDYPYSVPIVAVGLYLLMLWILPKFMKNREPLKLNFLLKAWNLFLSVASLFMFLSCCCLLPRLKELGLVHFLTGPDYPATFRSEPNEIIPLTSLANFGVWVFCIFKIPELLDTFFLLVRKKPVPFLHWYHHVSVLAYCWFANCVLAPTGFFFAFLNSFVHTIMYYYYFRAACGKPPSWGVYVTILQLSQMFVGIIVTGSWAYLYFKYGAASTPLRLPHLASHLMIATLVMYGSYFLLFLQFFIERYFRSEKKSSSRSTSGSTTKAKKVD